MMGLIFTISLLSILTAVGFLFAWMVRMASTPRYDFNDDDATASDIIAEPACPQEP